MRSVPGMPWMGWDGLGWMWGALFMVLSVVSMKMIRRD